MSLDGKVLAITGGTGALGGVVVAEAQARGAQVVLLGRADLVDEAAAKIAIDAVVTAQGRLDGVLTIAGGFQWRPVAEAGPELWRDLLQANVLTALTAIRAALPHLQPGAAIVTVAAAAARKAGAGMGPYAAAKSGVLRLTEALGAELAPRGVWVGSVSPTIIDTPANRAEMPAADTSAWVSPKALADLMLDLVEGVGRGESGGDVVVGG